MYNFKGMGNDADGHQFLAVVATVHHKGIGQALDYGALSFAETFDSITACGMGDVNWRADLNVVARNGSCVSSIFIDIILPPVIAPVVQDKLLLLPNKHLCWAFTSNPHIPSSMKDSR